MDNINQKIKEVEQATVMPLVVPLDNDQREEIRRKVKQFFSDRKIMPPVSYNQLAVYAGILIEENNWDERHKAFVMVCGGNEIWRPIVGSIPFERRMLLLPMCLRNSKLCTGVEDELGLLCSECGNCNICCFLKEAEDLGYITIVAEGTTIATRLVESGKVDAVVGVGCMDVLRKMFSSVTKYSIPAVGIPLVTCGCKDTKADALWVSEEINYIETNSDFKLLNINNLKDKTSALFTESRIDGMIGLAGSATGRMVREMLMAGGKRIRPLLTVLAYEAFDSDPDQDLLAHLAISVECFHKASLVHDDIEDNDSFRYGKETIHTRYGIPVAINLGDLLIGEGYRLLAESGLAPDRTGECFRAVAQGHRAMSIGQGEELMARRDGRILTMDEIIEVFRNKTSAAFKVSLQVGAIGAGADKKTLELLEHFSDLIGIAYQIKDDLEDFTVANGFSSFDDQSVLISLLAGQALASDLSVVTGALKNKSMKELHPMAEKYHIREQITKMLAEYLEKTYKCVEDIANLKLKLSLNEIVGKTFGDYV
ncbi:MAG: polyprenyl synthetase family protein [Bacteroidales bacterium]|nr:polyprenyl synthetase family protein [Bacteroidales bacterium]